jgi:hypothetical protein
MESSGEKINYAQIKLHSNHPTSLSRENKNVGDVGGHVSWVEIQNGGDGA